MTVTLTKINMMKLTRNDPSWPFFISMTRTLGQLNTDRVVEKLVHLR